MADLKESPSQTAGPYVHIGCTPNLAGIARPVPEDLGARMITGDVRGTRITVSGVVHDATGTPVRDALVELWQADADGRYPGRDPRGPADPAFTGWGRRGADRETGLWSFETVRPGPVPFPDGRMQAPHLSFWIAARGINVGLHTRMYFPDEDNGADPILGMIEQRNRVPTLIAEQRGEAAYQFDIFLQGARETVFFDI